jgi:hypothetical protein
VRREDIVFGRHRLGFIQSHAALFFGPSLIHGEVPLPPGDQVR